MEKWEKAFMAAAASPALMSELKNLIVESLELGLSFSQFRARLEEASWPPMALQHPLANFQKALFDEQDPQHIPLKTAFVDDIRLAIYRKKVLRDQTLKALKSIPGLSGHSEDCPKS